MMITDKEYALYKELSEAVGNHDTIQEDIASIAEKMNISHTEIAGMLVKALDIVCDEYTPSDVSETASMQDDASIQDERTTVVIKPRTWPLNMDFDAMEQRYKETKGPPKEPMIRMPERLFVG